MNADEISARDKAEVISIKNMIAPPGLVPDFPPNLAKARAGHDGLARIFPVLKGTDCTPIILGGIQAEKIMPPAATSARTILYLHGWGYALGSITSHRHLVAQLAQASFATAYCLDYRLAPEAPFPAAIEDGVLAYHALLEMGVLSSDIVIVGDSSGGGLAVAVALALKQRAIVQPAGLFLMSPWVDLSLTGASIDAKAGVDFMCNKAELAHWANLYAGAARGLNPKASPLNADLTGLPPMLIHAGSEEILLSDSTRLAERLGLAGVSVTLMIAAHMPHTFHYMWPFLTAAREAIGDAGDWIVNLRPSA